MQILKHCPYCKKNISLYNLVISKEAKCYHCGELFDFSCNYRLVAFVSFMYAATYKILFMNQISSNFINTSLVVFPILLLVYFFVRIDKVKF